MTWREVTASPLLAAAGCLDALRRILRDVKHAFLHHGGEAGSKEAAQRALLAVCSALGALITRCPNARAALLATHKNTVGAQLLVSCFSRDLEFGWEDAQASDSAGLRTPATPPASLDALAASLGGVPVPAATAAIEPWTARSSPTPRFDHALALFLVPLVGPSKYCSPRHPTHLKPPFLDLTGAGASYGTHQSTHVPSLRACQILPRRVIETLLKLSYLDSNGTR